MDTLRLIPFLIMVTSLLRMVTRQQLIKVRASIISVPFLRTVIMQRIHTAPASTITVLDGLERVRVAFGVVVLGGILVVVHRHVRHQAVALFLAVAARAVLCVLVLALGCWGALLAPGRAVGGVRVGGCAVASVVGAAADEVAVGGGFG